MNGPADPWHDASRTVVGSNAAVVSDVVDRLLADRVHPDDLPVGYREMARAFRALKSPASEDELSRESTAVHQALVLLGRPTTNERFAGRRFGRARVAALVVVGTLVASSGAAVANILPTALEDPIATALSHAGITVSSSDDRQPEEARAPSTLGSAEGATVAARPPTKTTSATGVVGHGAMVSRAASDGASGAGDHPTGGARDHPTGGADDHSASAHRHAPPEHSNGGGDHRSGHAPSAHAASGHAPSAHAASGHASSAHAASEHVPSVPGAADADGRAPEDAPATSRSAARPGPGST